MIRTRTLGVYIGMRFLLAMVGVYLLCAVLIYLIDFVELLRQSPGAARLQHQSTGNDTTG